MSKGSKDLLVFDEPGASLDPAAEASAFDSILSRRGQVRESCLSSPSSSSLGFKFTGYCHLQYAPLRHHQQGGSDPVLRRRPPSRKRDARGAGSTRRGTVSIILGRAGERI